MSITLGLCSVHVYGSLRYALGSYGYLKIFPKFVNLQCGCKVVYGIYYGKLHSSIQDHDTLMLNNIFVSKSKEILSG